MLLDNLYEYSHRVILCPRNDGCGRTNDYVLADRLTGPHMDYFALDTVVADDPDEVAKYQTEFLNRLEPNGFPPYKLTLKVGAIVMLLCNLDPARRLTMALGWWSLNSAEITSRSES